MMNNEIEARLDAVFREVFGIECVPAALSQKDCAEWDSVAHLNLILALEAEFAVFFEPDEIASMRSRAAVLGVLMSKI